MELAKFQSHYGLILTISIRVKTILLEIISIPLWSDFNMYGSKQKTTVIKISIPLWSDFNLYQSHPLSAIFHHFNPTMV